MTRQPNILWYCTDQQRFDTIGALGNSHVRTPAIDSLVESGTAFTHVYCQSPICTPSRTSFMTGLYPSRAHNTRNGNASLDGCPPLISKLVADAGYHCGLIGKFHPAEIDSRKRWRQVQVMVDHLWKRWLREYLPSLTVRSKWTQIQRNHMAGDLVLLVDENLPRGQWHLGRVVDVKTSNDGYVRTVTVKTSNGSYTRPANKVCLLEEAIKT